MPKLPRPALSLAVSILTLACAAESPDPAREGIDASLAAYGAVGQELEDAVGAYAQGAPAAGDACAPLAGGYVADAEDALARMLARCGEIDEMMAARRSTDAADSACVAAMMAAELAHHHGAACAGDPVAEAARHLAAMTSCLAHLRARYDALGAAMGMMPFPRMGGATWTCARTGEGGFLVNGQPWAPGDPLPGTDASGTSGGPWPMPCADGTCGCADDQPAAAGR